MFVFTYFERDREKEKEPVCMQVWGRERGRGGILSKLLAVSAQPGIDLTYDLTYPTVRS